VDLILCTDPDSDRLGLVVKEKNGTFTVLNGNQTGSLLAEFILRKTKERGMPKNPRIVKTIVTTELVREIAKHYGAETEDVLTGFKYIGDKIKAYESEGKTFLFGLEESYGYLKGTYARDKDAVVAAMLAAELAAECKAEGITLTERLEEIHKRYGYHKEQLLSFTFKGIEGQRKIESLMQKLRAMPPIEGETERIDYKKGIGNLPKSDVLKFFLSDGWIAARPSGTEPKIKFYLAAKGETVSACNAAIEKHIAWVNSMLAE
jgi:phosphoglucomutase